MGTRRTQVGLVAGCVLLASVSAVVLSTLVLLGLRSLAGGTASAPVPRPAIVSGEIAVPGAASLDGLAIHRTRALTGTHTQLVVRTASGGRAGSGGAGSVTAGGHGTSKLPTAFGAPLTQQQPATPSVVTKSSPAPASHPAPSTRTMLHLGSSGRGGLVL
jgi:hypothetical protein